MLHLAHVTGCGLAQIDALDLEDLIWWCNEAILYWNHINTPANETDND